MSEQPKYYGDNDLLELKNPHLAKLGTDFLYHFGLTSADQLPEVFGDVKYVCMHGSSDRARVFAEKAADELGIELPEGNVSKLMRALEGAPIPKALTDRVHKTRLAANAVGGILGIESLKGRARPVGKTERFELYKVGQILSVSHGMGIGSVEICLNEMAKLIAYAKARGVKFIRIGTSGGIGVEPGTVVITDRAYDDLLNPHLLKSVSGAQEIRETDLSPELAQRILACRGDIAAVIGHTVAATGFYEPQGRLDGAICRRSEEEKMAFVRKCHEAGVRNMEMEATEFAAFTRELSIPAADVCVALVNRLNGDQVTLTLAQLAQFSDYAQTVVLNFIKKEREERIRLQL